MLNFIETDEGRFEAELYHPKLQATLTYVVGRYKRSGISGWWGKVLRENDVIANYETTIDREEVFKWAEKTAADIDSGKVPL